MELIIDDRQDKLEVSEELIEKIKDIILECLDYEDYDDNYEVITSYDKFIDVKKALEDLGIESFLVSEITFLPKIEIEVDENTKEKVLSLVETLEENEDVQNVYHNMKE